MDDTQKTLLSIDLDTSALIKNAQDAKQAISDLTKQLNDLKAAGQANTPIFAALSTQLKTTTADYKNATKAINDYTDALGKKTQAEQIDIKEAETPALMAAPTLQAKQVNNIQSDGLSKPTLTPIDFAAEQEKKDKIDKAAADKKAKIDKAAADKDAKDKALKTAQDKQAATAQSKLVDEATAHLKLNFDAEMKLLDAKYKGYETTYDKLGNLFSQNTEASKAALFVKKAMTIAEVAISTEQSVAASILATKLAVANDYTLGPILGPVLAAIDIASGIADVGTTITLGAKQIAHINSITLTPPGKARGGIFESDGLGAYLTGPGTGTSDSINARLSNGESVINARSTAMFGPILSAINQAGGGVAFHSLNGSGAYAAGGLFNGSNTLNDGSNDLATTRATNDMIKTLAANLPRQVLVVEDVQASLQNKVMLQNMSNF